MVPRECKLIPILYEQAAADSSSRFRWVACQLDFLGDCLSDKECRDALDQLPPGLNESYMRILRRVPTGKERIVQMILNFVAYANPDLKIPILREALSVPEEVGKDESLDAHSTIHEGSIARLCRSLIRKSNNGYRYEFAHFSVKEFLEGEMMRMPEFEVFQVSESISELLLAKQCLNYLLYRNFSSLPTGQPELQDHVVMRVKQHPFYLYAAVNWPKLSRGHWMNQGLVKSAETLFQPKKTGNFTSWLLEFTSFFAYSVADRRSIFSSPYGRTVLDQCHFQHMSRLLPQLIDRNFTTLHVAAALSLPVICSSLIETGGSLNQRAGWGSPLQCAVQGMLPALPNDHGDERFSYYQGGGDLDQYNQACSSMLDREKTIRLLLKSGSILVEACSSPYTGQTLLSVALEVAPFMGDLGAVAVLLEAGHKLEADNVDQFTRLGETTMWRFRSHKSYSRSLESLVLCLSSMIEKSAAHLRLCQAAWSLAIGIGCEFAQDPSVVDTRISLSQDSLVKTIFTSVRRADIDTLNEALKDPRADITRLVDEDKKTIFENWLWNGDPDSKRLTILKILISAGMEVNRPNKIGLLPVHEFAKSKYLWADDDDCYEVLRDIISDFIRKGTGCTAQSRANQNVVHLGLWSITFIKAVLEAETEGNILTALRTRDKNGHTPITLAIQEGQDDVAVLLLERSNCDSEALRGPASIYALCVAGGAHRTFNVLLKATETLDRTYCIKTSLLNHVGPKTSKEFVLKLIQMFPNGLLCRVDGKLPIDTYLESCISCESPTLDPDVLQLLAAPESEELGQQEKRLVWENFTLSVQGARPLKKPKKTYDWDDIRGDITTKVISNLLHLGFVQSYEAAADVAGVLPLLEPLQSDIDDLWPLLPEAISGLLQQTVFWETLRESDSLTKLLKAAVKCGDVELVEMLLEKGVSVHQRVDEMSALETACLAITKKWGADRILFRGLLGRSDPSRLNEINPHYNQRKGLVHYLAGHGKRWQFEELLERGADINLRTNVHVEAQPAIVQHLWEGSLESAMALLDSGANPTLADSRGMDTALSAAVQGKIDLLLHLYTTKSQDWQLNWKQTCNVLFTCEIGGREPFLSGVNALHMAAEAGHCDVLRFYLDKGLLTDVNAVSVELWTPMHIAALAGQIDAVKLLYSRGASLNLKSSNGSLPLHLAVRNEHVEVVKFLVENGSAMDADNHGLTPMRYAIQLQNRSIVDSLCMTQQHLDYQPRPDMREKDLASAYEQALLHGDVKQCELLRCHGCPVNAHLPGQDGLSALVLAIKDSDKKLITWLLDHDAKAAEQIRTEYGYVGSPLQAMITRPPLNDLLPSLLRKYHQEGGSAVIERPSLICLAIQYNNTVGLRLLLEHIATYEIDDL